MTATEIQNWLFRIMTKINLEILFCDKRYICMVKKCDGK